MSELVLWPDRRLSQVCDEVPEDTNCTEIIATMLRVMRTERGIGISAPQIGEMLRIIVVEDLIMINPRIVKRSSQMRWVEEACLSFPETCPKRNQRGQVIRTGQTVRVHRHKKVKVEAFDPFWNPIVTKGRDWKGACIQHEIDHLDGITLDHHRTKDYLRRRTSRV